MGKRRYRKQVQAVNEGSMTPQEFVANLHGDDANDWASVASAAQIYKEDGGTMDREAFYAACHDAADPDGQSRGRFWELADEYGSGLENIEEEA